MKRIITKQFAMFAMLAMVFAFAGCSSDDDGGTNPTPGGESDQFAAVTTAGDTYFDDYNTIDGMGVNMSATAFFNAYTPDNPNYFVVDLRSATDFAFAHIKGAENWTLGEVVSNFDQLPSDQTILFTCYSGQTASYATSIVNIIGTQTGHNAVNLKFGASGILPEDLVKADGNFQYGHSDEFAAAMVTTDAPAKPAAGDFPTVMSEAETAEALLLERAAAIVGDWGSGDARMGASAAFTANPATTMIVNYWSTTAYANGHIDGAFQYTPKVDILSTGALNTLPTDKEVGFYCYTGQTSAQVAAYLRMAGYDVKTIMYGVNGMCFSDTTINTVQWHGPEPGDAYLSIFEGTFDD